MDNVMARIELTIPDEEHELFVRQARREGMPLSSWLLVAARAQLGPPRRAKRFASPEELRRFFARCDEREGPGVEPDWEEHLAVLNESKTRGLPPRMTFVDTNVFMYAVGKPHPLQSHAQQFFDEALGAASQHHQRKG